MAFITKRNWSYCCLHNISRRLRVATGLEAVVRPRREEHRAVLLVEREILDVDGARTAEDDHRQPRHVPVWRHDVVTEAWRHRDVALLTSRWRSCWSTTCTTRRPRCDHTVHESRNATVSSSVARPRPRPRSQSTDLGPDLQNILRQSYDYLTITTKLRSTCDGRLICKTPHKGRWAFLR